MSKPIQRKEVHLDTETIVALTGQAIRAGKSLKPYAEDVLIAQATTDLLKCRDLLTAICNKAIDLNGDLLPEIVEATHLLNLCAGHCR